MDIYVVLDLEKLRQGKAEGNPVEAVFFNREAAENYVKDNSAYEFDVFPAKAEDSPATQEASLPVRRGRKPGSGTKKVVGPLYKCLSYVPEEANLTVGAAYLGKDSENGHITVTDNENKEVDCPKEWFVKLR